MAKSIYVRELRTMMEVKDKNTEFLRKFGYIQKEKANVDNSESNVKRVSADTKRAKGRKSAE